MVLNLILSVLVSGSLAFLWGMINVMQMVVYTSLIEIQHPANALSFEVELAKYVAFDMWNTEGLFNYIFDFVDTEIHRKLFGQFC